MGGSQPVNPHRRARVEHFGAPVTAGGPVVVLVHGRGQSPQYMEHNVVARLADRSLAFVAIAAADGSWYPLSFLAPLDENQPMLDFALERLDGLCSELRDEGVDSARIVWCGFSQGACLLSQYLAGAPRRWGGLLAFTGGMLGPPGTTLAVEGDFGGMPAYFATSEGDAWVPADRVRETADCYRAAGAAVTLEIFEPRPHEIYAEELDRARELVSRIGGPAPSPGSAPHV